MATLDEIAAQAEAAVTAQLESQASALKRWVRIEAAARILVGQLQHEMAEGDLPWWDDYLALREALNRP